LRERFEGDERGRRPARARGLRGRAGAPHPRRGAQGRGLHASRAGARAEREEGPPDRRDPGRARGGEPAGARRRPTGRRARHRRGRAGRRRLALPRLRELRPVRELRGARRGVQEAGAEPLRVKRGIESSILMLVTLGLVAFGLVMVYSATSASAALANGDPAYYLKRQAVYAFLGLLLMAVCARLDFHRLRALGPVLMVSSVVLLLAVLVLGQATNGARRWISFGPAQFQPSELAKLALAVWAASYLARRRAPRTLKELWRPIGLTTVVFCGLILVEPDLGTAIAIVVMISAILLVSGIPGRTLGGGLGIAATLGLMAVWFEPYRRARLFSFLNPWQDAQGAGFQTVQAMIGLGSGGIFGVGLGQSVQKANYLPEAHTDMIFAIIGEELGLVGATFVIAAYCAFAYA